MRAEFKNKISNFWDEKIDKNTALIMLKLFYDILFVFLIFFGLAFIADSILPGIVSSHFGLYKIIAIILLVVIFINLLSKKTNVFGSQKMNNKKTIFIVLFFMILFLFNSFLSLSLWLNILLIIATVLSGYFVYKSFFEE